MEKTCCGGGVSFAIGKRPVAEARRLVEQGGVKINGEKASAANAEVEIADDGTLIQVGKRRFLKLLAS